jgi:hypothetical protein
VRQILPHVDNLPKKPITSDKTKPLGSQRVGPESGQLGVIGFAHLIVPFGTGKCQSQHALLHLKE